MKLLISQIEFEQLIGLQEPEDGTTLPPVTIVYFTAGWCSACRRLNLDAIESATAGATWLKCDVDVNNYTAGYCGIRSIPTFLAVVNKKILGTMSSSKNEDVINWVNTFTTKEKDTVTK